MPITDFSNEVLGPNDLLIDVRTPGEFAEGHFDGSVNIDWMSEDFIDSWDTIPKGGKVYLYCKKGGRSAMAADVLDSLGMVSQESMKSSDIQSIFTEPSK